MRTIRAVDLFCGAGGTSTGLLRCARKLGLNVDLLAVNHWAEAIETHELNHPGVRHLQEDLGTIDPRHAVPGGRLDLLWASPECTSHSYSRGGKPISEQSRSTAWHPLKWCDQLNVKTVIIENVPSFRAWGPTDRSGRAIRARRGETYQQYIEMLRAMGYTVDARVLNAADYGAAQTRKRLFIVGLKGSRRICWPEPTHAPSGDLLPGLRRWRAAKEIIDWSIMGKSIFNRKKPHARKTLERILIGGERFWPALKPYLPILRNHLLTRSTDDPIPTVAAGGTHIGLAQPFLVQVSHSDADRARPVKDPMMTITGSREVGVTESILVAMEHGGRELDPDKPLPTITTAKGGAFGVAEAFLSRFNGDHKDKRDGARRNYALYEPLRTIDGSPRYGLVEPFILPHRVFDHMTADPIHKPLRTITTTGRDIGVVEPILGPPGVLIPFNGERKGQSPRAHSIDEPFPTVTTGGAGQKGLARPILMKYSRTGGPRSLENPLDTLTTRDHYGLVLPEMMEAADKLPIGTVTAWGIKIAPDLYLDILFRMLRVSELAQGQGFPKNYRFAGTVEQQVKQVGNAVEVHQAEALCRAVMEAMIEKHWHVCEKKRAGDLR